MIRQGDDAPLILSVDDNEGARYAKTRILRLAGFRIIEVASGTAAIEAAVEYQPDLILLDTRLPDLNGFEVCARLRADATTRKILILQTSASFLGSSDKIRALEGGADNYLTEPIDADELIANIRALLRLRRVERDLVESEMRFREIAENVDDVFWMYAPHEWKPLYVSPMYERLWKRNVVDLISDELDWLHGVYEADRDAVKIAFTNLMNSIPYELEYRLVDSEGRERWVNDRGYVVHDDSNRSYRMVRFTQEITDRKCAERALQDADRRKDEFLATLAHELRNPLGPILHAIQMMEMAPSPDRIQKGLAMVERQTHHLIRLVDDLLDIARITKGKIAIKPEPIELAAFTNSAVEATLPFIEKRGHQLSVTLPTDTVWLYGDATRLSQVIANLLNNAAKYTLQGGVIRLDAVTKRGKVFISVIDNGIGIPEEKRDQIFDLFAQADHAPDRAQDGLGIGLSLVKTLVEMHGGSIHVANGDAGVGARFEVQLPIIDYCVQSQTSETPKKLSVSKHLTRVMVVDDNIDSGEMLVLSLRSAGYEAVHAANGTKALDLAQEFLPEAIFCDIGLPGMDGYEVARCIRQMPALRGVRLIALTGYGNQMAKDLARSAGFDHHLTKPTGLPEIQELLIVKI